MANRQFPLVRGRVFRFTRLDGCGEPVLGPDSVVVSEGVITVNLTAQNETGETISITNAAGKVCILDEPAPKFTGWAVEVQFCGVNPALISMTTGQPTVLDADNNVVGFDVESDIDLTNSAFALEMWSNVPSDACEPGAGVAYGYFLIPFLKGGSLADFSVANAAINFTLTGARSKKGSPWAAGPYDVQIGEDGQPGPLLNPISNRNHLRMIVVNVEPPEPSNEPIALGIPATGATAGTPGSPTPANSYAPASFATIGSLTASPTTAWTSGQHIVLRDGSTAHWSGTAWVAGTA
jgi:hypothetical protein